MQITIYKTAYNMKRQEIINRYPSIFKNSVDINIDDDKLDELNTICRQISDLDLQKKLNVKEVAFRFNKVCFDLSKALTETEDKLLHENTEGLFGIITKVVNGSPICPECESTMMPTRNNNDLSEYWCWFCDIRTGRFNCVEIEEEY